MKSLRRYLFNDRDYFITIVTFNREPILLQAIEFFWLSWTSTRPSAWVILPDHAHLIVNSGDKTISEIIHAFKIRLSRRVRDRLRTGRVWQSRFWDHVLRDQEDMNRHLDYIHYNPVKHALAASALAWEHSSFRHFVNEGFYREDWGRDDPPDVDGEFGE